MMITPVLFYAVSAIALFAVLAAIYFFSLSRRTIRAEKPDPAGDNPDIQYLYDRLKTEYESLKKQNLALRDQVDDLRSLVKELEEGNLHLLEQKELLQDSKQKLEVLQGQKEEVFAMVAHDTKNSIGAIRSLVELLNSYDLNAQEQQEVMQSLVSSSDNLIRLANEITTIARQEATAPRYEFTVTTLKGTIDKVCSANKAYALQKQVKLVNKSSLHTPEVKIDPRKFEEVVDNLVNNAIKYGKNGTLVHVSTYFNESKVTLEVSDDGPGLSQEDLKKVFSKGVTLSTTPTGGETASGLGLWIVKKIVEDHNGTVWVKSKQGVGSTFGVELPIARKMPDRYSREIIP